MKKTHTMVMMVIAMVVVMLIAMIAVMFFLPRLLVKDSGLSILRIEHVISKNEVKELTGSLVEVTIRKPMIKKKNLNMVFEETEQGLTPFTETLGYRGLYFSEGMIQYRLELGPEGVRNMTLTDYIGTSLVIYMVQNKDDFMGGIHEKMMNLKTQGR
jgi:hypothetical protein